MLGLLILEVKFMAKNSGKITYTRFVYSIIDFLNSECQFSFDVSSYIKNEKNPECQFANSRISKFIYRYRARTANNRLFLTISMNDTGTKQEGREIISLIVNELLDKFLQSSCIETLKQIDESAFVEVFSSKNHSSLTDYLILIFNVSASSAIECIISTDSITSRLIERDEDGNVIEFNSKLHFNLRSFKENLQ